MKVKTYRAPTLAEALAEAKSDLGIEAVIVQTRRIRQGGFLGMLATEVFEVIAAVDPEAVKAKLQAARQRETPAKQSVTDDTKLLAVHLELAGMRKTLETAMASIHNASAHKATAPVSERTNSPLMLWARKNDIESIAADTLLSGLSQSDTAERCREALKARVLPYFQKTEGILVRPGYCKIVAMIGPTGVGKTTTVAKLAANFALREKVRVALITADTYRIAAVEQLRTYSDLIGIPIEVVYTPQDMQDALHRQRDKQLILIDTAGRSPANQPQMLELETLMAVDNSIEKHLVLSATTKFTECLDAVRRFQVSNPQKYLFTKIDEACNMGTVFSLMHHVPRPISYIATGQNVPDDIELAKPERLTTLMLRGLL